MARRRRTRKNRLDKTLKWVLATGAAALLIVGGLLYVGRNRFFHPDVVIDHLHYPVVGIDVSNHNGRIDFDKVKADGVSFVYLKASEGKSYTDPSFKKNYTSVLKAGMKVGAYHFFRKKTDGVMQADKGGRWPTLGLAACGGRGRLGQRWICEKRTDGEGVARHGEQTEEKRI